MRDRQAPRPSVDLNTDMGKAWKEIMTRQSDVIEGIRVGCWAVAVLLLACTPAPAAEPALVIQGASIFDAASGTMKPDRTIVLSGQKIQAVGTPEQPAAVPKGARILDGKGKFAIPGLIDAHVHLVHRLNYAHMTGDEVLPLFLANGVTTVRDTGDEIVAQTLVARHADTHPEQCPRVFRASGADERSMHVRSREPSSTR